MENKIVVSPRSLFERPEVQARFQNILGKKAPGFIVSVINCINDNENLKNADPNSILFAAANAATLDLPINPNLGFAYIIPYNKKQPDGSYKQFAQFQMGYKGFIQLAMRSGQFQTISAAPIFEGQLVEENPLTGFKFDFTKKESDKVIGYAAYFKLINGFEKTLYMTIKDIQAHGRKYSKTFGSKFGRWETDFEAMATKTVVKLLLAKFAPLSIEMLQKATLTDQAVLSDWDDQNPDYVDNEDVKLDLDAQNKLKEEARIKEFIESAEVLKDLEDNCYEYCSNLEDDHELKKLYEVRAKELKEETKK